MFELKDQEALITHSKPRAENHGKDHVPACDIYIAVSMPNTVLDLFSDELRKLFFVKGDPGDADLADQGMPDDHLPILRYPELKEIAWNYKAAGYRIVMNFGVSGDQNIYLINSDIDNFKFEFVNGGVVNASFRINAHPNEQEMGRLCSSIKKNVVLTVEPPSAEDSAQMEIDNIKEGLETAA